MREKAPKKILVVDDHERVRTVISRLLAAKNYLMVQASNGEEAYTKAVAEQPDLIMLDIMMPVMDGYEALLKIKEHPVTQATPVLMLSGLDQHFKQRFALEMGALGYLVKPVRVDDLYEGVKSALDKRRGPRVRILPSPPPIYHPQN
jgi:CheY-like chemotaxis protein